MFSAATPGTLLTLAAAVLLGLVTISVPILKSIYFLEATIGGTGNQRGQTIRFGTLGYCIGNTCSPTSLGYSLDPNQLLGIQVIPGQYSSAIIKGLTYNLILHPIALAFAAAGVLLGAISHCREMSRNCFGTFITSIGAGITVIAFGLDLALFLIARKRINSVNGASASLGYAIWMTLAAWLLMFLAGCSFGCGMCGSRRRNRVRDSHIPESYGARPAPPMQDRYGEQMRMDALDAEAERKRRQATLKNTRKHDDLPKFAEYETEYEIPLKDDYDNGAYPNGASHHQPGVAYSTNHNMGPAAVGGAAGSAIAGVGQGYSRRQVQDPANDFSDSPPMLSNSAGHGAHNLTAQRQNMVSSVHPSHGAGMPQPSTMSNVHEEATYIPGVGPQPYRDGVDGSTLSPHPYPMVASPPPMDGYSQGHQPYPSQSQSLHQQYQSQSQQQQHPQYDAYGNIIPSSTSGPAGSQFSHHEGSHFNQPGDARRQPTGDYGHPTDYSGATFGPGSPGFAPNGNDPGAASPKVGSRLSSRGARTLPSIPQQDGHEQHEIVFDGAAAPGPAQDRRQGTVDDGFGLASGAHQGQGSQRAHSQHAHDNDAGYDHYASSAYEHQSQQHQPYQASQHEMNQYNDLRHTQAASSAQQGQQQNYNHYAQGGSQYNDYQSSAGPPGYESVHGSQQQQYHQQQPSNQRSYYPHEKY